ncbi:NUDIX hydrolase [Corynebacterium freneyi]|uniref:NUDIX hydrolase n=1 Tax=Corynebacterium freneyi TaxID=134034 RepID=UPI00254DC856|nr:NUDIX hydrolase [Corynebacterium freneyi]MDK8767683.1 NUDIX hydrolase [Corynebacterium freneyi]
MSDAERNEGTAGPQRRRRRRSRRRSGRPQDGGQGTKRATGSGGDSAGGAAKGGAKSGAKGSAKNAGGNNGKSGGNSGSGSGSNSGSRPNSGSGSGSSSGSGSNQGSGSGNRSRRRRRGGRGRGSGGNRNTTGTAKNTAKNTQSNDADSSGGGASRSGGGSRSGASRSGGGSSRPNSKSGAGRGSQRRRQATQSKGRPGRRPSGNRPAQRGGDQRDRMRTSIETSAGGLVVSGLAEAVRDDGTVDLSRIYVALIGRLDRRGRLLWSMPKGHVEPGEAHDTTAEREVWEETGIHGEVIAELGVIDYWFISDGTRIHKTVHHHLLRYVDGDLNDEDPEVTEVTWFPASSLVERLAYADERKLARRAHDLLPDLARAEKDAGRATPR